MNQTILIKFLGYTENQFNNPHKQETVWLDLFVLGAAILQSDFDFGIFNEH